MIRLCLVIFILAAVPISLLVAYVVWMVKTWRRGRKRLFWCQCAAVVIGFDSLFNLSPVAHWFWEWREMVNFAGQTAEWTGTPFSFNKQVYRYDSARCWNGDGYSLVVLELPPEMARYFSAPPSEFFANYPKKPDYRREWRAVNWHAGPIRTDEKVFTDFVFMDRDAKELKRLEKSFAAIRCSLAKPTTYYAYFHHTISTWDHTPQVCDIDFFVIDPEERLFYLINFNT